MASGGFNPNAGPRAGPLQSKSPPQFGNSIRPPSPSPSPSFPPPVFPNNNNSPPQRSPRPTASPPGWNSNLNSSFGNSKFQAHQGPSSLVPYGAQLSAERSTQAMPANFQDPRRTRSPPSSDKAFDNYTQDFSGRSTVSPRRNFNINSSFGDSDFQTHQGPSSVVPFGAPNSAERSFPVMSANFQDPRGTRSPPSSDRGLDSYTQDFSGRPAVTPPGRSSNLYSSFGDSKFQTHIGPSSVVPYGAPLDGERSIPSRPTNFQDPRRTRSPPSSDRVLDNYTQDFSGRAPRVSQRAPSPPQASNSTQNIEDHHQSFGEVRRWPTQSSNFQPTKNSRSPPIKYDEFIWTNSDQSRGDIDRLGNTSSLSANNSNSTIRQMSSPLSSHKKAEGTGSRTLNSQVPKRNRSPSFASAEEHLPGTSYSIQDDSEREMQAKAKRLARFGVELSQPVEKNPDVVKQRSPVNKQNQALVERRKLIADQPFETAGDFMQSDYEVLESSNIISGLCPDMCPESERQERERKGDLDRYERLDGDRNQTSISLAVKKYNRTAEREADLIRPMPVLQQTIRYLLALLDQPYDHKFLGMYNFLWDRMRAIRMDLRMQHLFNQDAITMLEQMIRLHIIAMHELCEYTKGEGFSEGFDAHLNIEQMNKTSVELFQMYDDHRKRGIIVVSEQEFRGYYALLKLDKHPGYKVEPAELSLDLAKMTPEIRQTSEILFSREVARACRTANFIAFFRLARKATYLQACLIHAHFAKLRTQALASLHSGLQNGQGIPISHIIKWLGMEDEDIEGLLEYHGFIIKEFEESYMVKEGPFLNNDKDYPTKCSRLVHSKKSRRIIEDVSSSIQLMWPTEEPKEITLDKIVESGSKAIQLEKDEVLVDKVDEVMLPLEEDPALKDGSPVQRLHEIQSTDQRASRSHQVAAVWDFPSPQQHSPKSVSAKMGKVWDVSSLQSPQSAAVQIGKLRKSSGETLRVDSFDRTLHSNTHDVPHKSITERSQTIDRGEGSSSGLWVEDSTTQIVIRPQEDDEIYQEDDGEEAMILHPEIENEIDTTTVNQDDEVVVAKLKLILRKWKRLSSKRKELREQRKLARNAALTSLPLGPPIQQIRASSSHVPALDFDLAVRERHERHQKSWSRLNTSEAVGEILSERNPEAKCLCWKLIVFSQPNVTKGDGSIRTSQTNQLASHWLHDKLMGVRENNGDDLVVCSQDLSIWKKWVIHQYGRSPQCCVSVIREVKFSYSEDTVDGAAAVLFLLCENVPLDVQKTELDNLLKSLPSGSCVPLLILCNTHKEGSFSSSMVLNGLGLHNVDNTRISCSSVVYLMEDETPESLDGFYSSDRLKEGLQWLASRSPVQPVVRSINLRDLVMDHLSSSLRMLENTNASVVGPNHCISAFNEALDTSATEVAAAVQSNRSGWPCFEVNLLESSNEHSIIRSCLPNVGWSSAARVEPILNRLEDCKLPFFQEDLSWLSSDNMDILHRKVEFEKILIRYISDSTKMMDKTLAATEASVIVQYGALPELRGSKYHMKPKWVTIFRRIFSWRVMNLSVGVDSSPYVLEHRNSGPTSLKYAVDDMNTDVSSVLHDSDMYESLPTQPTLDEMLGVCYSLSQSERVHSKPEASKPISSTDDREKEASNVLTTTDNMQDEENPLPEIASRKTDDDYLSGTGLYTRVISDDYRSREVLLAAPEGAEKLSKLFEKCMLRQQEIAEKLSIYMPKNSP